MNYCYDCKSENIMFVDGYMSVCADCGVVQDFIHFVPECDKGDESYMYRKKNVRYKCSTYFKRILRCLQNKSMGSIPEHVIKLIKENTDDTKTIKDILHDNKLFEYYINMPQIEYKINKKKPIFLSSDEEIRLYNLFVSYEEKIRILFPKRTQTVRYKPLLKRLLIMIDRKDIADLIPDLKNKRAITAFNHIWQAITV